MSSALVLDNETTIQELESFLMRPYDFGVNRPSKPRKPVLNDTDALDVDSLKEHTEAVIKYNQALDQYNDERLNYTDQVNIVYDFWKERIYEEFSSEYNKAQLDKIFSVAYECGHSAGYYEVRTKFEEYANFVTDVLKLASK